MGEPVEQRAGHRSAPKTLVHSSKGRLLVTSADPLVTPAEDLVQQLQAARQELGSRPRSRSSTSTTFLVLDDLSYVQKNQAETSVLFELISARYERRSLLITANQPFGPWNDIFPDPAMTVAAIDRLVHHAIILEMNTDSYRRRSAEARATARHTTLPRRTNPS